MKMVLCALLTMSMLVACSNDDSKKGGANLPPEAKPLSLEQKTKFNKTLDSYYILDQSSNELQYQLRENDLLLKSPDVQINSKTKDLNQKAQDLKHFMQSNCEIDLKKDFNTEPDSLKYVFSIKGSTCPVSTVANHNQFINKNGVMNAISDRKLQIIDTQLKNKLDIASTYISSKDKDDNNESVTIIDIDGFIETNGSGRINITGKYEGKTVTESSYSLQQTYNFQYPDFNVKININQSYNQQKPTKKTCTLNGQEISEEECSEIILKLGLAEWHRKG